MPGRPIAKLCAWLLLAALLAPASTLRAQDLAASAAGGGSSGGKVKASFEADADASYVGESSTNFGRGSTGEVSEQATNARFVVAPQWGEEPIYRFGLGFQRYSFGLSAAAPLPNTLQAVNAIVGVDFALFDSWLFRVEAQPGMYSDFHHLTAGDFNCPFIIGGSYIAGADLQWVLGLSVDFNRSYPVFPDLGVRWGFATHWVLDAVLPNPRLEYDWSRNLSLFAGGDFQDGTFRVDRELGQALREPRLSHAIVEYEEIRVGAGFSWKASGALTIEMEGGYLPYRQFDFSRAHLHYGNENGAPYGQVSVNARF